MSVRPPRSLSHSLKHQVYFVPRYLTFLLLILVLGLAVSGSMMEQLWDVGSAAREPQHVTSGAESLALAAPVKSNNVEGEPTLGNYPNTLVQLGGSTTITPDAAPTNTTSINVSTSTSFNGKLTADPLTGVVRVTNAHPVASAAPGFYTVTVKAFSSGGATITRTFTLTVDAGTACGGTAIFTSGSTLDVGFIPYSVAIGDFNNDGNQDIAIANHFSNTVSIRLGDGAGSFSGTTEVSVGADPYYVAIGDFNNDGNQDFATTDTDTVSIRLGDGLGGFSGTNEVSVGSSPGSVAIGDFNNDGNQDFAVAKYSSNTISIRLGDGTGSFSGTTEVSAGSSPGSVAIGDFNNDDKQDLAAANYFSYTVSIRLGNGSGGFSGTTEVRVDGHPRSVAIGDFNNDGKQDLATANDPWPYSYTVSIRLGDGLGGFSGTTELNAGKDPTSIVIGDFNNDGNQDLATDNSATVSIRLGDGTGRFSGAPDINSKSFFVAIGDFNNDGNQDFAIANLNSNTVSIRLGRCGFPPTIATATGLSRRQGAPASNSQIATVTDDGGNANVTVSVISPNPSNGVTISNIVNNGGNITADIAAHCAASNANFTLQASDGTLTTTANLTVTVTANTAPCLAYGTQYVRFGGALNVTPAFASGTIMGCAVQSVVPALTTAPMVNSSCLVSITNAQPLGPHVVTIRALDSDGAVTDASFTLMVHAEAVACDVFSIFSNTADVSVGTDPQSVATGDFDNDGNQDMATANYGSNRVSIRLGDGAGGFSGTTEVSVGSRPISVAIGDFNNDGKQDLATANSGSNTVSIRFGDGLGGVSGTTDVSVDQSPSFVAIVDFNNDGKQDFAVACSAAIFIHLGDGMGGFDRTIGFGVANEPFSVAIVDFNNDDNQDLAVLSYNKVSILLSDGGHFRGTTEVSVGVNPRSIASGDFNNDGNQDLAAANYGSNTVSIRLGNGLGAFSGTLNLPVGTAPRAVAIGDFNNDGNQDFATANDGSGTVSIRYGNGLGGFSGAKDVSVGGNPYSVAIADFNNDGMQDFVTANAGSNAVSLRLGHCDNRPPTIAAATGLSRPQNSVSNAQIATVTDANGNGSVAVTVTSANPSNGVTISNIVNTGGNITADIATSCAVSNATFTLQASDGVSTATDTLTITVTANTGPCLTYASPQSVYFGGALNVDPTSAGGIIASCAVQRVVPALTTAPTVNSSGVVSITNAQPLGPHIITIRATDNGGAITDASFTLMVQPAAAACAGASTFTNAADVNVAPSSVAIGDFNNDGNQDIAAVNYGPHTVSIRLGDGSGGFSGTTEVSVGGSPHSVAIGDFNNDGSQDIATANSYSVSIRLGDGLGGFTGTSEVQISEWGMKSLALGDFNNDGKLDLAAVSYQVYYDSPSTYSLSIHLGDGAGRFTSKLHVFQVFENPSLTIGDFNSDGKQDLAVPLQGSYYRPEDSNKVWILLGLGAGHFSGSTKIGVGLGPHAAAVGDFNNDGKQDFATANSRSVSIRLGDGAGGFSGTTEVSFNDGPGSLAIGDFNNDGKQDLAVSNSSSKTISIRLGDGLGGFSGTTEVSVGGSASSVAIGDFNNDGKLDFAANSGSNTVSIRLGHCDPIPTIAATTGLSRQQGSLSNSQIATVTDDSGNGNVAVTVTSTNPSNGVTISNIVNTGGNITADIVASCGASNASFTLQASDGSSSATSILNVSVIPNTAPTVNYADPPSVTFNGSLDVTPAAASDNSSITSYAVQSVVPALTTAPTVNPSGVVSITNAQPAGTHTITIRATDNCGAVTNANFTLNVARANQTITFDALANKTLGEPDFALSATASSGLPVSFSASGQCTVAVNTVHLTGAGSCTITASQAGDTNFNPAADVPQSFTIANRALISFSQSNYDVDESADFVTITVNRTGDLSVPAQVDYATDDAGAPNGCGTLNSGMASSRCDFGLTMGTLRFADGETQKTFEIPITHDSYSGGAEKFTVKLSNLSTADIALATPSSATVTIHDSAAPAPNAIDDTETFVCMMYHDFLNREPDPAGLAFWMDNIDKCKDPRRRPAELTVAQCTEVMRINTSAAFFLSIEFQATGNLVRSFYVAALDRPLTNNMPGFVEFERDTQAMQRGVIIGQDGWQQTLDNNRDAFIKDFVTRAEFVGLYPLTDTPWQYVNKLYAHAGIIAGPGDREAAVAEFGSAITAADAGARGRALFDVTQHPIFQDREMNRSFVQMEYFGYLRRNPNDAPDGDCAGYDFWVNKLNAAGGNYLDAEMVKAFLSSSEYRCRFGP